MRYRLSLLVVKLSKRVRVPEIFCRVQPLVRAAATVLSEIFGDIDALEILGGAGAGAIGGLLLGGNEAELVSIDPNNDLDLTLETDLTIQ